MNKRHAHADDEVIEAVLNGYYRFANRAQAVRQMDILKNTYLVSKHAEHKAHTAEDAAVLWIRGYELSAKDKAAGLAGHFAHVTFTRRKDGSYGFAVKKLEGDAPHPEKKRTRQKHPNWGHPVLRSAEKGRVYPTPEAAVGELIYLQQEYPEAAVPGKESLTIGIYGRAQGNEARRVKRYVLSVTRAEDKQGWIIAIAEKKPKARTRIATDAVKPVGKFTSRLALRSPRRKK